MPYPYYPQQFTPYFQQQQQNQSSIILVRSEQEAYTYPVAPGNSVTFKDESRPYCYVKTMSFNQLDRPTFERYRLVKEDAPSETPEPAFASKDDLAAVWAEINTLKAALSVKTEKEVSHE